MTLVIRRQNFELEEVGICMHDTISNIQNLYLSINEYFRLLFPVQVKLILHRTINTIFEWCGIYGSGENVDNVNFCDLFPQIRARL